MLQCGDGQKASGIMQFCVDYRKTNEPIKDKFPLPKIDSCLDALNGSQFLSSCDLHWGIGRLKLIRGTVTKAFVTRKGQWLSNC